MGSGFSFHIFSSEPRKSDSPQFSPYSSIGYHKKGSKTHLQNHKNSYIDLNMKYQLANQRWNTIRQYEKLGSMVLRNFSKSLERGKNNSKVINSNIINTYDNVSSDSANRNNQEILNVKKKESFFNIITDTANKNIDSSPNKIENSTPLLLKPNDFLDHSNQLLINQEENYSELVKNNDSYEDDKKINDFAINILDQTIDNDVKNCNSNDFEEKNNKTVDLELNPNFVQER